MENFEWDEEALKQGRSGGTKCRICHKYIQSPRKRKVPQKTWLTECDECEIQDPLKRAIYKINTLLSKEELEAFIKRQRDAITDQLLMNVYLQESMDVFNSTADKDSSHS